MTEDNQKKLKFSCGRLLKKQKMILKEQDISKLNNVLTRAVCVGTYNVPVFGFNTGHVAFCPNASRAFMYESTDDEWYELG